MAEQEQKKAENTRATRKIEPSTGGHAASRRRSQESHRQTPPVLSRNNLGLNAVAMEERHPPRRRVDVSLASPGAEIQLPAVPTIQNYWRLFSGVLSVGLLIALVLLWDAPFFKVKSVDVQGAERFAPVEISRAINAVGNPVFAIHPDQLEKDLRITYSGFSSVDVQVVWPADVRVVIRERNPVIAWNWEGHVRWVDEDGIGFDPHGEGVDLITIQSPILPSTDTDQFLDPKLVSAITNLVGHAPEGVDMVYDPAHGLGWEDSRGWKVYFGLNPKDMERKMLVYQSIVKHLNQKGIQPSLISVEYLNAPYFRMGQ
jgi:hypothetical protein